MRGRYASTVAKSVRRNEGGVGTDRLSDLGPPLEDLLDPWFDRVSSRDFLAQVSLVDLMTYLPGDILTKVDRTSMACSLEARVPLLDHRMVEFAASLPSSFKMRDGKGKWIFREAISELLPPAVLNRPKRGFAVPLRDWFRKELRHRMEEIQELGSPIYSFLDSEAVRRVVSEHARGRRNHSGLLWRILVLHLWLISSRNETKHAAPNRSTPPALS
jgi:asparagine synthase (glutamine-hydrolysing)